MLEVPNDAPSFLPIFCSGVFSLAAQSAFAVDTAAVITNMFTAVDAGMASLGGDGSRRGITAVS